MKQTIRLTESELRSMITESVRRVLKENFMDDLKTNVSYAKNKIKDALSFDDHADRLIKNCKQCIEWMQENLENKQKCGSRFLHTFKIYMEAAKEYGYVKYYKHMKQLYDKMVEEGLFEYERDIEGPSFKEIYADLNDRMSKRGGHMHG